MSGSLSSSNISGDMITPVSDEALSRLAGIDYSNKWVFEEIRDDVLDAIKKFGDRYDLRQQGRSSEYAMFVLSPDSIDIHMQLVRHFEKRPEFSVKIELPPTATGINAEETVVIYRRAKTPLTLTERIKSRIHLIAGGLISAAYLYYIGTASAV